MAKTMLDSEGSPTARPDFKQSAETEALVRRLAQVKDDALVTYAELSKAAGMDVTLDRSALQSARRHMLNEHNVYFGTVYKEGIKRLDPGERVAAGSKMFRHIRRYARRGMRILSPDNSETLPPELRFRQFAYQGAMAVLSATAKPKKLERIELKSAEEKARLPLNKVLDALRR